MLGALKTAPAASSIAITPDEFAALMARVLPVFPPRIAVAVSGGPDSTALAFCTKRWADTQKVELVALIVDHALRPESAWEAEETQKNMEAHGITAKILHWEHPPLVARLHITARKARYRLLTAACREQDIDTLMLGHQQEDQAETVLMRLAKGSGIDGLAGMQKTGERDGIRLVRPFLDVPRARLTATCRAAGLAFINDPSNHSDKFARGRLRRILPLLADEGLTIERLTDLANRAGDAQDALNHYTHLFLRGATRRDEAGTIRMDLEKFRDLPAAVAQRAVIAALQHIHPQDYAPEQASLLRLLEALRADGMTPATLHGCLISRTESEIAIMREPSAVTDIRKIQTGENMLWDNRWQVMSGAEGVFDVRSLGNPPHEILDRLAPGLRRKMPQGRARASLPSLWRGDDLVLIPALTEENAAVSARLVRSWPPQ